MQNNSSQYAATIGFFDGVHLGHRFLLKQLKETAKTRGLKTMAITFFDHPRRILDSDYQPQLLTTLDERIALIQDCGIDVVKILDFTEEFCKMTSRDFMKNILRGELHVECLLIGYDHHFGSDVEHGFNYYKAVGQELGVEVISAEPFAAGGECVSSSYIRQCLADGDVVRAATCLQGYYSLSGIVVNGRKIGRQLGFPTANINLIDKRKILPKDGTYAVQVLRHGKMFRGVLNIGHRPTFNNGTDKSIEIHILDFCENLYGEILTVKFLKRLRGEMHFDSLDELKNQIEKDVEVAKNLKTDTLMKL